MSETTSWVNIKPEEVERKVIELAREGKSPAQIGLLLRDQQGIPRAKLLGLRIKKILEKNKLWEDPENHNLKIKIETLIKHQEKNKHDESARKSHIKHAARVHTLNKKR
jgi:small subunit ribosomal protein S15